MNISDFDDYKEFLRAQTEIAPKGIIRRLAEAAGCQRSYMSQVLNSHVQLTPDHCYGISLYLGLSDTETDYFLQLLEKSRSANQLYKRRIEEKIKNLRSQLKSELKNKRKKLSHRLKLETPLGPQHPEIYYSAWYYSAIHIATSIGRLKTSAQLASYLSLPQNLTEQVLRDLEKWQLVEQRKSRGWSYIAHANIHLDDASPLSRMNHMNWRMRALDRGISPANHLHYTSVFTLSRRDVNALREKVMEFIELQRKSIAESGTDELVSFCCDYFVTAHE